MPKERKPKSELPLEPDGSSGGPRSERPRSPASRRPPTVSGKTRIVVSSKANDGAEGKRRSEAPTMPPPPMAPPPPRESKAGEPARKKRRGIAVDEVTANLTRDPRSEK